MYVKGTSTNDIGYKGIVTAHILRNGKKYDIAIHNNGTKFLTDTIAQALCGESIRHRLPTFLNITYTTSGEERHTNLLLNMIPFTAIRWEENEAISTVTLNAIITPSDKSSVVVPDQCDMYLQMYDPSGTNLMASVMCTTNTSAEDYNDSLYQIYTSLDQGTEAIIEWKMQFINM